MPQELRTVPFYDRNAKPLEFNYGASTVAPHSPASERFEYTVPKGKMAWIENCLARILRDGAATAEGLAICFIQARGYRTVEAAIFAKTLGEKASMNVGHSILLYEGDKILGMTVDLCADGTCSYQLNVHLIEFDAFPIEELPFMKELPKKDIQEPDSVVKGEM